MPAEERVRPSETVIVVSGGPPALEPDRRSLERLSTPPNAYVIAADSGIDVAFALDQRIDAAIGDFDSVSPAGLAHAERIGVALERRPEAKEATDLELALDAAIAGSPDRILVIASPHGRLDHLLSSLLVLGSERYASAQLEAIVGEASVNVIRGVRTIKGRVGELLSLHPIDGPAEGVTTSGLVYPLFQETLEPGSSRGVSNVFAEEHATIALERGVLLAIQPGGIP